VASSYIQVAQQLLLAADRNPNVIVDVVPPKQMPPLPRAYGAMDFGGGPRVVLAATPGGSQRSYAMGETIGEFKVLAVTRAGVIFLWDGKQVAATFDQLRDTSAARDQQAAARPSGPAPGQAPSPGQAAPAPAGQSGGAVQTIGGASAGNPGPGGADVKPCAQGDPAPNGAIVDGYKKLIINWGMGKTCQWERVK
jgi:hypothetical protein